MAEEVVLLRIQLSPGDTVKEMEKLTRDLTLNKEAQVELNKERKLGKIEIDEFSKRSVELSGTIKAQQREYAALQKDLELYNGAIEGTGTSYKNVQAALSLAQRQYQGLAGSADNDTEATQALTETIEQLRARLAGTDAQQGAFFRKIGEYPGAADKAATATTTYGNSVVELKRKLSDLTSARDIAEDTDAVQKLNAAILETRGAIQEATGKVDEFGDRIEKNSKKEELATLGDAFGGVTAAIQLSTLAMTDQEDAEQATAVATTILAQAEAARNLQIGLASVKDAVNIGLLRVKKLLYVENTVATAANATATVAQAGATEGATLAQRALNLAMKANPVGLVVIAVGLLVSAFFAFRNASEATQKKVKDITETVLRFGTPVGLVITGVGKLYDKFELVRRILDPVGKAFDFVAAKAGNTAREIGEAVGVLDTAQQKAAKASAALVESTEKEIASYQLRARQIELAGAAIEQYRSTEREGLVKNLEALKANDAAQNKANQDELRRIDAKLVASEALNKKEKELADARAERQDKMVAAQIKLTEFDQATQDQIQARGKAEADARKKELDAAKSDAERQKKLAEQRLKNEYATQKQLLDNRQQQIARGLMLVQEGSAEELRLLQEQANNATRIQLVDNSAAQVGATKQQAQALVAARKEITANGEAEELKRLTEFALKKSAVLAQVAVDELTARISTLKQGSDEELATQKELIEKQRQQQLLAIGARVSAEQRASQQQVINANAAQQTEELVYQNRLRAMQQFYQQQRNELEQDKASGRQTEEQYNLGLFQQEIGFLAARRTLNKSFNRDTAADDQELTDKKIANLQRYTDKEKEARQEQISTAIEFGSALGQLFADTVSDTGATLEDFARKTLILILDTLQKTIIAAQVKIITEALASPESIATFGVAGFAKAALLIAGVTAAFGAVKGALSAPPPKQFAQGTLLGGASHTNGGTQLYGRNGHWYGEAEAGEAVINKRSTAMFLPILSALNVAGGGKQLLANQPYQHSLTLPRFALGGLSAAGIRESIVERQLVAPIEYDKLAAALKKVNLSVHFRSFKEAKNEDDFTDSIANAR